MKNFSFASDIRPFLTQQAADFAQQAVSAGADAAEALLAQGEELSVKVRLGKPELLQEAGHRALGLRIFWDHRAAVTYTSDFSPASLRQFFSDSVELCRLSEPDPLNELPAFHELSQPPFAELDLWDDEALLTSPLEALEQAKAAEAAALAYSPKITNSEGATYDRAIGGKGFACASKKGLGFAGATRGTYQSLSVEPLCDDQEGKKRNGNYYTAHRFVSKLLSPKEVGQEAARRTVAKLGAVPISTQTLPVVFAPESGRSLLQLLFSVLSGGAIYRQSSYLCGKEGQQIASPLVTIVDDPLLSQASGSRPFDGEGLASRRNLIIDRGVLKTYLLDTYSARKLNRSSNGCAGRSIGGSPHVVFSNFVLQTGTISPPSLLDGIKYGLYVTEMMGFGFNPVTGDFSRGAAGFVIENGQLTRPVSEVTISAPFAELMNHIDAIGSEADFRSSIIAPAFRVSQMTVAGT